MTTRTPEQPPHHPLRLAAWFGLVTGFGELLVLAQQHFYPLWYQRERDKFILLSRDVVWMGPLADVVLFSIAGILLVLLFRIWPRLRSIRLAAAVFSFLGFLSLLCLRIPPRLPLSTKALLAAGLAAQASYLLTRRPDWFQALVRRTLPWMAAAVVALALGVYGWETIRERRALANQIPPEGNRPNVLLIVLDTVRAGSMSLYGHSRPTTPRIDQFASSGVVFDRAFSTAPWTLPSMASLFTGRFPRDTSADWWEPLNDAHPTLAEVLGREGYATAGFVGNMVFGNEEFGLARGFSHWEVFLKSPGQFLLSSSLGRYFGCWMSQGSGCDLRPLVGYYEALGRKPAERINGDFLAWLGSRDSRRPFFAFLNYFDAHHPYLPAPPFDTMFGPAKPRRNPGKLRDDFTREEAGAELDAYEGEIASLDQEVGRLFDQLSERRLLENTLVIVTSDHGESFLEHGVMHHGNSLYAPQLHVPLVMSWPSRLPAGMRVREPATLRDIPATILELAGLGSRSSLPGASLSSYWAAGEKAAAASDDRHVLSETSGRPDEPRTHPVRKGNMTSLVIGSLHYIRNGDGTEELFDIAVDPWEQTDLARDGKQAELERFRAIMTATRPARQPQSARQAR
jgi:arylsulfatase A-like enzyme